VNALIPIVAPIIGNAQQSTHRAILNHPNLLYKGVFRFIFFVSILCIFKCYLPDVPAPQDLVHDVPPQCPQVLDLVVVSAFASVVLLFPHLVLVEHAVNDKLSITTVRIVIAVLIICSYF